MTSAASGVSRLAERAPPATTSMIACTSVTPEGRYSFWCATIPKGTSWGATVVGCGMSTADASVAATSAARARARRNATPTLCASCRLRCANQCPIVAVQRASTRRRDVRAATSRRSRYRIGSAIHRQISRAAANGMYSTAPTTASTTGKIVMVTGTAMIGTSVTGAAYQSAGGTKRPAASHTPSVRAAIATAWPSRRATCAPTANGSRTTVNVRARTRVADPSCVPRSASSLGGDE